MSIDVLIGILIPFVGTALGAACVFFLKDQIPALAEGTAGICFWRYGGGIRVVTFNSCD